MTLKVKRTQERAVLPKYAHDGDACFDVSVLIDGGENAPFHYTEFGDKLTYAFGDGKSSEVLIPPHYSYVFHTGLKVEMEKGYAMKLHVRSSTGIKKGLVLSNVTGIIDSGYRGEIMVGLTNVTDSAVKVCDLERVVQAEIVKTLDVDVVEVDELSETDRGEGGIGSSGGHEEAKTDEKEKIPIRLVKMVNYYEENEKKAYRYFEELYEKYGTYAINDLAEEVIKKCIEANRYRYDGSYHQYGDYGTFVFEDPDGVQYMWLGSMRYFGAIMADVWSKLDATHYDYMDFYMYVNPDTDPKAKRPSSETEFLENAKDLFFYV